MTEDNPNDAVTWPARLGGVLLLAGTALSMLLDGVWAEAAMGAALLGLVLALARLGKSSAQ
ncbi:MAG: hypothetical protein ACKN9T_12480 [Candidatus Methylumidiphilus sp.]